MWIRCGVYALRHGGASHAGPETRHRRRFAIGKLRAWSLKKDVLAEMELCDVDNDERPDTEPTA